MGICKVSTNLLVATALTGSMVLSPVLATRPLAADITNTFGDAGAGSLRAAAATLDQFMDFRDLGAGADITLLAPVQFTIGSATIWRFAGNTTSVTVGGSAIEAAGHLYFYLSNANNLTLNSDLDLAPAGTPVALVHGGNVTFNGDISSVDTLMMMGNGVAIIGTTTSPTKFDISDGSTLRFATAGTYTSNLEIENVATVDTGSHNVTINGAVTDDGTNTFVKAGTGTLTLGGTNTASGTMRIDAGTLSVASDASLSAGTITLNGGNLAVTGATTIDNAIALASSGTIDTSASVVLSGTITGTGTLGKSGAGTLTLTGANSHSGGTTISAGTLQIGNGGTSGSVAGNITNNGALVFNRSDAVTYGGMISGTGSLTKSGAGTLTLSGTNSYTGGMTLAAGRLVVNGSTGAITLNGGTLGGSGTVGTLAANSGSTIAPGNSIGTLTVAGNTGFAAGSTYAVEVDRNGNADRIAATGTVVIDSGATVSVSAENGTDDGSTYNPSTTYTIISAGTGVTGTFGSVTENFAFLDAALGYSANAITLVLTRNDTSLASAASTDNQRAAANGVTSLGVGNAVYDVVVALSTDGAREAFNALSGEVHASAAGMLLNDSRLPREAATDRVRAAFAAIAASENSSANAGSGDAWGQTYGAWARQEGDGNAAAFTSRIGGMFLGADTELLDGWRGGILAGYGITGFETGARSSSGSAGSYTLGAYAGTQAGPWSLRIGATQAWHDVTTSRTVAAGTLSETLTADYWGETTQAFAEAGYTFEIGGARLEPFAGLAVASGRTSAFDESGGAAALSAAAASHMAGITTLGIRAESDQLAVGDWDLTLKGSLAWQHVTGDVVPQTAMQFANGNAFTVAGAPIARDTAIVELGLNARLAQSTTVDIGYHGEISPNAGNHGFKAGLSVSF